MENNPHQIPIAEQAKSGPIFDVRREQGDVRISPLPEPPAVLFECPSCKAIISTTAQCPFCSASIDPGTIKAAGDLLRRLNQASSEAGYLRLLTGLMLSLLALRVVVGWVPARAEWCLLLAVPVMAIRWWTSFARLQSDDPDFQSAKRDWKIAVGVWVAFLLLGALVAPVKHIRW